MMHDLWPGLCALVALAVLLLLVIRWQVHAFVALFLVSLDLGLAAGMSPAQVIDTIQAGVGGILRKSLSCWRLAHPWPLAGGVRHAELIARRLLDVFGVRHASFAVLSRRTDRHPDFFNVGFLLLIPIIWRLQRETRSSLLYFLLPLTFSLASRIRSSAAASGDRRRRRCRGERGQGRVMVETIVFGSR